jgi:DNA-binding NarL/FixJ family response regulator
VAVIDAAFGDSQSFPCASTLLEGQQVQAVAMLDDVYAAFRAQQAAAIAGVGYFTRFDSFDDLCQGIGGLLARTPQGSISIHSPHRLSPANGARNQNGQGNVDDELFLKLSPKERQVMEILARGHTVAEAAQILKRRPSTVDNQKARLMKKLRISHMTQITRIAMRVGLID